MVVNIFPGNDKTRSAAQAADRTEQTEEGGQRRKSNDERLEKILLEQIRSGDDAAFEKLVLRHTSRTINLAYRLVTNQADAEDIAQEAFLRLHKAIPGFRGESRISTWLYTTVTRLAMDHIKREQRKRKFFFFSRSDHGETDPLEQVPDSAASPQEELLAREMESRLIEILKTLSPQQRAVFAMRHQEGLSLKEIAEILNLEPGTVKAHLHRAVTALRKKLNTRQERSP